MTDLADFLRARLDEDEANARAALALWPDTHFTVDPGSLVIVQFHRTHDPARVLREVAAKRAIVDAYEEQDGYDLPEGVHDGRDQDEAECDAAMKVTLREVVETLAAVYSDHPDYRAEWSA